jgi:lipid-A-disaccharide synthase
VSGGSRLFLAAGEPSGDLLGGALLTALQAETGGAVEVQGVGGPAMAAAGLNSLFPQEDLAVMGLVEVLPRLPTVLRRLRQTTEACLAMRPDALITIDSPSFGLRVARRVRAADPAIRTVHYVAPSVWAWRPGRAKRMAGLVDQVLALLPFEPPYFTRHGIACDFVGHPALAAPPAGREAASALRASLGIGADAPVLLALPGSRMGEVRRHADLFGAVIARLAKRHAALAVVIPTVAGVADAVKAAASGWPAAVHVLDPRGADHAATVTRKRAAFAMANAALAASGTVTLELAAAGVPMVSVYRVNPLTAALVRRIVTVRTANLVNLVAGEPVAPEFLQEFAEPAAVADALEPLLRGGPARAAQLAAFGAVADRLGRTGPDPATRAARAILAGLSKGR